MPIILQSGLAFLTWAGPVQAKWRERCGTQYRNFTDRYHTMSRRLRNAHCDYNSRLQARVKSTFNYHNQDILASIGPLAREQHNLCLTPRSR